MNKKNIIILVFAIALFILALVIFIYANSLNSNRNSQGSTNTSVNQTIVDSKVVKEPYFYDIDGNKLKLADFEDKPQAILLWKSDNSKSYDIINLFQKYYNEYKDKINFLAINVNEADIDLELVENIKAANFNIPIYFDNDFTLIDEFAYKTLPYLVFIDANGTIGKEFYETIDEDSFQANLELMSIE